jgi:hypothetical protein
MFGFTEEQIRRYSRQIILPDVGGRGQKKLLESRVLLIGAGWARPLACTWPQPEWVPWASLTLTW